jgi:hypothetical protein
MTPFEKAFARARAAGETEFTFNGKRFNTRRADGKPLPLPAASDFQPAQGSGEATPLRRDILHAMAAQPPEDTRNPMQKGHGAIMTGLGHAGNVVRSVVGMGPVEGAEDLNTVPRLQAWARGMADENAAIPREPSKMSQFIKMLRGG